MYRIILALALLASCFPAKGQIEAPRVQRGRPAPFTGRMLREADYLWVAGNLDSLNLHVDSLEADRARMLKAAEAYQWVIAVREAEVSDGKRQAETLNGRWQASEAARAHEQKKRRRNGRLALAGWSVGLALGGVLWLVH